MGFNVADGKSTYFWTDRWLGNLRLLDECCREVEVEHLHKRVVDYWKDDGWDWNAFQHYLPNQPLLQITAKALHPLSGIFDSIRWRWNPSGEFTVRSAAWHQLRNLEPGGERDRDDRTIWKKLWSTHATERQKNIWLAPNA